MPFTTDEITELQERLRHEIMERECALAALHVIQTHTTSGRGPKEINLGAFVSGLFAGAPKTAVAQLAAPTAPAAAALPPPPPPKRYIHAELEELGRFGAFHTEYVRWAITRMTTDYSLHDLEKLLRREGYVLSTAQISVVLTRLKKRGEIEEIAMSYGPNPARFRGPHNTPPTPTEAADVASVGDAASTP